VKDRTSNLRSANEQLKREITERKRAEKKLLGYQEKLRSVASELSLGEERERRRIAVDLHEDIGQVLALSKIKLGELRESISAPNLSVFIEEIYKLIEKAIQDIRSLTVELSPPVLYELGLEQAVDWLTEQFQEKYGIVCTFKSKRRFKPLDDDIQIVFFQAVRELLVNVRKHGKANKVEVSIHNDDSGVKINVEDDGIGFDTSLINTHMNRNSEFGLFSIQERLDHLGGYLKAESKLGHGTRITMVVPLKKNNL